MTYPRFDRSQLNIKPLEQRKHDICHDTLASLDERPLPLADRAEIDQLGRSLVEAKKCGAARMMLIGAHVIRAGVARHLIDLMERGLIDHLGMNGAGVIHDYELARIGATCERVGRYIRTGEFGLWRETGEINDIVRAAADTEMGMGEAVGQAILQSDFPHIDTSVLAAGARLGIPITVHVGIGYDILHEHPNFDPAACGLTSYRDFLCLCQTVTRLEKGVFLCLGSAVMGPEVYLKALAMARNVAHQRDERITDFTTAVFDLHSLPGDRRQEAAKSDPSYYFRPWKTILVRTVADGGHSYYVQGDHRQTVPHLRLAALAADPDSDG